MKIPLLLLLSALLVTATQDAAGSHITSDGMGGYWSRGKHITSDGMGGFWTPSGHVTSDGMGGYWAPGDREGCGWFPTESPKHHHDQD